MFPVFESVHNHAHVRVKYNLIIQYLILLQKWLFNVNQNGKKQHQSSFGKNFLRVNHFNGCITFMLMYEYSVLREVCIFALNI